jgi:hypothetical protein
LLCATVSLQEPAYHGKKRTLLNFIAKMIFEKDEGLVMTCKDAVVDARMAGQISWVSFEGDIAECAKKVATLKVYLLLVGASLDSCWCGRFFRVCS